MGDSPQEVAEWERLFKHFDTDGDGKISASELGEALKTIGSNTAEEIKKMMDKIDSDGDGSISYDEFVSFARANKELVQKMGQASSSWKT